MFAFVCDQTVVTLMEKLFLCTAPSGLTSPTSVPLGVYCAVIDLKKSPASEWMLGTE